MLSNEKYMGNVRLLDNGKHDAYYLAEGNNPAIISKETFQAVQIKKQQRSNVIKGKDGSKRRLTSNSTTRRAMTSKSLCHKQICLLRPVSTKQKSRNF
jgi:site-specific DNA recombinase